MILNSVAEVGQQNVKIIRSDITDYGIVGLHLKQIPLELSNPGQ